MFLVSPVPDSPVVMRSEGHCKPPSYFGVNNECSGIFQNKLSVSKTQKVVRNTDLNRTTQTRSTFPG